MPFTTLDQILRHHASHSPDRVAMEAGDRSWTYGALRDEAARVAQALISDGIQPQDRIAVLDRNVPEFFDLLFGAAMVDV
ncbi:MAG: AMP-binding protein, partial [bacterium]